MRDDIMRMWAAKFKMSVANIGLMAPLWLLCTLTIPGPLQAAVYFDSDFETCKVGTRNDFPCEGWDDHGIEYIDAPDHNKIEIVNSPAFTGSKAVKGTYIGHPSYQNPTLYHSIPQNDHLFARVAVRRDPSFVTCPFNNSTKLLRWRGSGSGYPIFMVFIQSLQYKLGVEGGWGMGTAVYSGGPVVSATSWDQVEVEVKMNRPGVSDGVIRLWVNGTLYIERLNLQLRGPTPTSVNSLGLINSSTYTFNSTQYFAQCGVGNLYLDRFAVGNTRIGLATGQTSSDTTPPATPSGVRAP